VFYQQNKSITRDMADMVSEADEDIADEPTNWGIQCSKLTPSGKHTNNYGASPFLMDKSTISMAIFNGKLLGYQRVVFGAGELM
jgi:hypothetical protein